MGRTREKLPGDDNLLTLHVARVWSNPGKQRDEIDQIIKEIEQARKAACYDRAMREIRIQRRRQCQRNKC